MKIRNNGSRIFLTELMFSILFFIVIAAVCVQCFAHSVILSHAAEVKTEAVNLATNEAETFLSEYGEESFTKYYDDGWKETDADGTYKITGIVSSEGSIDTMHITVSYLDTDEEIYSLTVEKAWGLED